MAFLYRLLPPRRTFSEDMTPAEAEVMGRHVAYWQDLLDRHVALAFGPVRGPTGRRIEAATEIGERDPAVQSGTCTYEVVPMQLVRPG